MTKRHGSRTLPRWFAAGHEASLKIVDRFHATAPPPTIFHYTSASALVSIIQQDELWLSDATFLNDRVEVRHGRGLARECLQAASAWEGNPEVLAMVRGALELLDTRPDPAVYVACFSLEPDDLTQWRAYHHGDVPVALELEHGPLMFGYTSEGVLQQVRYDVGEQRWTFVQLIKAYWEAYTQDVLDPLPGREISFIGQDKERAICSEKLYFDLWRHIVASKDPAFKAEREVRFTYTAHEDIGGSTLRFEHPLPKFRATGGRIVPYLTSRGLHFRNRPAVREAPPLPVRSVRIGPVAEPELVARGVRRLLDTHGHGTAEILHSSCPFR